MGYNDLGDFFYARGDLQAAFKSYVRTRDYCTTSKHIINMCLNVILVSIELGHFVNVTNYMQKAEQTPDNSDPVIQGKLKCAAGLAHLENKKYKLAARKVRCSRFQSVRKRTLHMSYEYAWLRESTPREGEATPAWYQMSRNCTSSTCVKRCSFLSVPRG